MKEKSVKASEFDKKFDSGEDLLEYFDLDKATRPGEEPRRVSVDFPEWMVHQLDRVSNRLGITRQSVIKIFIFEKLKEQSL